MKALIYLLTVVGAQAALYATLTPGDQLLASAASGICFGTSIGLLYALRP